MIPSIYNYWILLNINGQNRKYLNRFEPIKIVYYFSSVAVVKKGKGKKFVSLPKIVTGSVKEGTRPTRAGLRLKGWGGRLLCDLITAAVFFVSFLLLGAYCLLPIAYSFASIFSSL
jgi:hypothetical protein